MNTKKFVRLNIFFTLLAQAANIVTGFILPRLFLDYFGSEVNGLITSICQFLNYITLLEGGLTGVITAALYKPLVNRDSHKVSAIVKAATIFFRRISYIFIIYSVIVGIVYPLVIQSSFSFTYVFSLFLIIGFSTFAQYVFAIPLQILLVADQHGYIRYITQTAIYLSNLLLVVISIKIFPSIHVVKIIGSLVYLLQPIIFTLYVRKHYRLEHDVEPDNEALSQRWNGFGQNIAYFIHTNTDVTVISLFASLTDVSIYGVYFMVIGSLRGLVGAISSAVYPTFGNILAGGDRERISEAFDNYEFLMNVVSCFAFSCCIVLIKSFIHVYTLNITDADYSQAGFAIVLCVAEAIYCMRDPYVGAAYAAGHFRQTAKYAYIEAGINIVLSVILIHFMGLMGIALGTLIAMFYRMVMHVIYIRDKLIYRPITKWLKNFLLYTVAGAVSVWICLSIHICVENYLQWILYGIITACITLAVIAAAILLFQRSRIKPVLQFILPGKNH